MIMHLRNSWIELQEAMNDLKHATDWNDLESVAIDFFHPPLAWDVSRLECDYLMVATRYFVKLLKCVLDNDLEQWRPLLTQCEKWKEHSLVSRRTLRGVVCTTRMLQLLHYIWENRCVHRRCGWKEIGNAVGQVLFDGRIANTKQSGLVSLKI